MENDFMVQDSFARRADDVARSDSAIPSGKGAAVRAWIEERTGLGWLLRAWCNRPIVGGACFCKSWPTAILFAICVQAMSGFFLWTYYSPSALTAWESVYYIQHEVTGGWLVRAIHHYGAQVLMGMLILYVLQMILTGGYRAPREMVFWSALAMAGCAMGLLLTGDLLVWDQNAFAATTVRTGFLKMLPVVGESLHAVAIGGPGPELGTHTLTRFFALHVGLLAAGLLGLFILHALFRWKAEAPHTLATASNGGAARPISEIGSADSASNSVPAWPGQALHNALACLMVLAIVLLLACQHGVSGEEAGAPLGSPADPDPANAYAAARPEWVLVGLYEFSHLFPGWLAIVPIFIMPALLAAFLVAIPFIARYPRGHGINVGVTLGLLGAVVVLSGWSLRKDAADPLHQAALAEERELGRRVRELARGHGIPPTGALMLLRNDAFVQGPRLFKQHCASCHNYATADGQGIVAEEPSAPNLYGFANRRWIEWLLDPKPVVTLADGRKVPRIQGPDYFGNTAFRNGEMVEFVKDTISTYDEDERRRLEKLVVALSAEAQLKSQREPDAADAAVIAAGREEMRKLGCTDCHPFHGAKGAGKPDLTGYGSRQWTLAIIANPADPRFYGSRNDRMPAYQETLTAKELELLTDWLRGEWFEP
jgi:ubiquinol-cytochrome c reductase cytochrome b subunit